MTTYDLMVIILMALQLIVACVTLLSNRNKH